MHLKVWYAHAQTLNFRMRQCINVQKNFCVSENLYAQRIKKAWLEVKRRRHVPKNATIFDSHIMKRNERSPTWHVFVLSWIRIQILAAAHLIKFNKLFDYYSELPFWRMTLRLLRTLLIRSEGCHFSPYCSTKYRVLTTRVHGVFGGGGTTCLYLHAIRSRPKVGVYIPVTLKFWPGGGTSPPSPPTPTYGFDSTLNIFMYC